MPLQDPVALYKDVFSDDRVGQKVAGMTRSKVADFARQLAFAVLSETAEVGDENLARSVINRLRRIRTYRATDRTCGAAGTVIEVAYRYGFTNPGARAWRTAASRGPSCGARHPPGTRRMPPGTGG